MKKLEIWLLFICCCINGYGQIVEEDRYMARVCNVFGEPGSGRRYFLNIGGAIWMYIYDNCEYTNAFSITPSQYQSAKIVSDDGSGQSVPFCSNLVTNTFNWSMLSIYGPAIIDNVSFQGTTASYACSDRSVQITLKECTNNMFGNILFSVECSNSETGNWVKVMDLDCDANSVVDIPYSYFINKPGLDPLQPMYFRTVRKLPDGSYTTNRYVGSPRRYLPKFEFPAGSSVKVDPSTCPGSPTIIKIPGTAEYNVTVKGTAEYGWGSNLFVSGLATETIDNVNYYLLPVDLASGTYNLKIENRAGAGSSCAFETTFTVPEFPAFTISDPQYLDQTTDNTGKSVQIKTTGGNGRVLFTVSGSKDQEVNIHAGDKSF